MPDAVAERVRLAAPDGDDWPECVLAAEREGLGPLLHAHARAGLLSPPEAQRRQLLATYVRHRRENEVRLRALAEVLDALDRAAVPVVVLKGPALIHFVYRDAGLRFIVEHCGLPRLEDFCWIAAQEPNVYGGLAVVMPFIHARPRYFAEVLSELLWWLDDKAEARRLHREAEELKARFNDAFWMPDLGFMAMGLEAHGRPIKSIGSNGGHCLAAGIVDERYVRRTADRLFEDDLFSGWGIRTLSDRHPAYNPYSYHRGSVWPVEHGSFALGFLRYGLHDHVERICRAQFEAAALFDLCRLPELFSGHGRDDAHPFPAIYPRANWPQAWSSSAIFTLVQSLLGLYPYAPLNMLLVDPHLPAWLPEITIGNLHVGDAAATIRLSAATRPRSGRGSGRTPSGHRAADD